MKATRYFLEQVLRKRPYIEPEQCFAIVVNPIRRQTQPDNRVRHWGLVVSPIDGKERYLRVITLEDGETLHNAFFDRNFEEDL